MKYYFCSLFDKNYLAKGLNLYSSLIKSVNSFHLWILCMDSITLEILQKMNLSNVTLIALISFEDSKLRMIKKGRTKEEYCWTCTPSLPLYILKKYTNIDHIGYLDADLFFYSDITPIFQEWGNKSILIIPHRFPKYLQFKEKMSGKFNVSMVLFKRDKNAIDCLTWWRDKCIEWCFHKYDGGRLGDQLYLNSWPKLFKGVHVLQNHTAGVAPWNVLNYNLSIKNNNIYINNKALIFYHFHGFSKFIDGTYKYVHGYELTSKVRKLIYEPYIHTLNLTYQRIQKIHPHFNFGGQKPDSLKSNFRDWLFIMKLKLLRVIGA